MGTSHNIEPELSVGEIIRLYLSHWRLFLVLLVIIFGLCVAYFALKVPFVATSSIIVNDSQNSAVQAFSTQFFGLSKTIEESKKGSSLLSKHIEYLRTREFYELLLTRIHQRGGSDKITMEEKRGYEILFSEFAGNMENPPEKISFLQRLDRWTQFNLSSDFEIKVKALTPSREVSLFLSNTTAELAAEILKVRELSEIGRVEDFMTEQKKDADVKLAALSKQLAEMQNKDDNLLPLASKEKMGDYVSELIVRANELKLKISENQRVIQYLERGRSGQRESTLHGVGGKIESLKIENRLLSEKLTQVQAITARIRDEVRGLPFAQQVVEDLRKKSEFEFNRYKELSSALAKLEAQKLSIGSRFEVLEVARWESTLPQIGLLSLGLLALILSQCMGSLIIYFKYLWNPHVVTAQASRNLVIFDNHSADPRVIIENSKIKFSLKKPEAGDSEPGDEQANVAWNVLNNVGQGNDLTQ